MVYTMGHFRLHHHHNPWSCAILQNQDESHEEAEGEPGEEESPDGSVLGIDEEPEA